ncbi:response regulator transcription factor [Membranihabitans maritimus]|uniref:response regulator transcription factor n=1 Tax=Membranihabitans maritimus TaxID=2904244 RepID=UPI001F3ED4AD|nr:response regulator transcription factor [Membranihabitans maritimus]
MTNKPKQKKAIVFDDHRLFAESFGNLIEQMDIFRNVHTIFDDRELVNYLMNERSGFQIYLFADFYLQGKTFIPMINELRRIHNNFVIIIVSSVTNPILINEILSYPIHGFLSKSSKTPEIIDCKNSIDSGKLYISPTIQKILDESGTAFKLPFTDREIEVIQYFAKGLTVDETAAEMNLSRHTVAAHRSKMMNKAGCKNIIQLLAFARKVELI